MKKVIILRYGEIHLKGHNRGYFERILMENIRASISKIPCKFSRISGRYLVSNFEDKDEMVLVEKLSKVFGLVSLSVATEIESNKEEIEKVSLIVMEDLNKKISFEGKTFKVKTTRADKSFPVQSDTFSAEIGGIVLDKYTCLKVDLHNPDIELFIDIRENGKTYILSEKIHCVGGMPVSTAGGGLLMLSGGIDSPVAGYMMAKRGMKISAIHFHSFPYTSVQAKEKVLKLAEILTDYTGKIKVYVVPFTRIQEAIHMNCDDSYMITIMRRIMMRISEKICQKHNLKTVITGESLGQVASQTIESITVTNNAMDILPVMRPCIGMDKWEIVDISKKIGAFETSILPYEDCCTVFLPKNPIIKPSIEKAINQESFLNVDDLVDEAVNNTELVIVGE